jgi:DNA replication factor GINS
MDDDEFDYKTLRKIQESEKQSPMITKIPKTFYAEVSVFLKTLQDQFEKETKQKRKMIIADEIQNIEKIVINIYEQREKKIIIAAMSRIRGGNPSVNNLLDTELTLFETLQDVLKNARDTILSKEKEVVSEGRSDDRLAQNGRQEKKTMTPASDKVRKKESIPTNDHAFVTITKDMPTFVGTDTKQYTIKRGDVLSIPPQMADMLIKRRIAEKITMRSSNDS